MISPPLALAAGLLGLALASAWSLSVGPVDTGLLQALRADSAGTPLADAVLWQLRAPRVALAILAGAVLAVGGCAMQALFRNPLAEPGLLGLSSGAALGAAVAMVLIGGLAGFGGLLVPLCAFGGALAVAALVTAVSRGQGQPRVASMLLAGLAVNAIAGAGLGLLATIADDRALRGVTFWLFGSVGKVGWGTIAAASLPMLLASLLPMLRAPAMNALMLGEAEAFHLGVDVARLGDEVLLRLLRDSLSRVSAMIAG